MKTKITLAMIATTLGTSLAVAHSPNVIEVLTQAGRAQGAVPSSDLEAKTRQFLNDTFKGKMQDSILRRPNGAEATKPDAFRKGATAPGLLIYKVCFYAGHGDKNQVPNQPFDQWQSHGIWPPPQPYGASFIAQTDSNFYSGASTPMRVVPMNIAGYPVFTPANVREASLKVDVLFDPSVPQMQGNYLMAVNDQTGSLSPLMQPAEWNSFWRNVMERGKARRWISIVFDLTPSSSTTAAYLYDINAQGNPIPGKYMGPFMAIPTPWKMALLSAAQNGNLQLYALPYCVVSHAELVVKAL